MTTFGLMSLGFFCYFLGILGLLLQRDNLINILVSFEVMLLGLNLCFIAIGYYLNDLFALVTVFIILVVAAAESVLTLAVIVCFYRLTDTISVDALTMLKG